MGTSLGTAWAQLESSPAPVLRLLGQGPTDPGGWRGVLSCGQGVGSPGGWAGVVRLGGAPVA